MKKAILSFLAILILLSACETKAPSGETSPPSDEKAVPAPAETETAPEESEPMPVYTGEGAGLLYLRDGNTTALVGLAFGDAFDYGRYEISGSTGGDTMYRVSDSEYGGPSYLFSGAGHRFNGFAASGGSEFLGITTMKDTLAKVGAVLGEPDAYGEETNGDGFFADYLFQTATLHISIMPDRVISSFIYRAFEGAYELPPDAEAPTEYETDLADSGETVTAETVYQWGNAPFGGISNNAELARETERYPQAGMPYDEGEKQAFVAQYLRNRGAYRATPNGVTYDENGLPFVEHYTGADGGTLCFVVWIRGGNHIPPKSDAGAWTPTDLIYCVTLHMDEAWLAGSILYESDLTQGVTRERLYDAWGQRMASVGWREVPGVPFPFLTEWEHLDTSYDLVFTALCRGYKTWFYGDTAEFDAAGRFLKSGGSANPEDSRMYFAAPAKCVYGADGRLEEIREEAQFEDGAPWRWELTEDGAACTGRMLLDYSAPERLSSLKYRRFSYGTQDSSGTIFYDTQGRMLYNRHYITHGEHINIFLYEGDATRPWASLYWCNHTGGFDSIYLFR